MTKVKNFKGVCTVAHIRGTPNDKKGIRMTLRDNTDEIVWESWLATPEVRTELFYYVSDPGVVEPHKEDGNRFKDSHDWFIKGQPNTRITQVRKDDDMPEFLTRPIKLDEVESTDKFIQTYGVVYSATPKVTYNKQTGKAKQDLRIIDDTGTSMPLLLLEMQNTDSFLAGDVLAMLYPDKTTIKNEPGLQAFASKVATGIGSAREEELMKWYAQADHDAFETSDAQQEEFGADLAAYKLTIQDKNPDEFKELVDNYVANHPLNK